MAPLIVQGGTLGQKHQNYNRLVNEAIKNNPTQQITAISYDDPDLDNLYRIDMACNRRNVDYVLEVLKCEDMLYVSRVIKQSTWLITDQQYSNIINPDYLYNNLKPQMMSKAFNKLILNVRLNLEAENRVEEFFNYYKQKDLQNAFKWLPRCSVSFIENVIQNHADDIPKKLWLRLCRKSITFLEIYCRISKVYCKSELIEPSMYLLHKNVKNFLDILESTKFVYTPVLGPKYTKVVMEKYPERIMNNLEKYVDMLDAGTFAKYLKREEVKDFILTHIKNKKMSRWFVYKNIKHFLNKMPIEERFEFIKTKFIEQECDDINLEDETWDDVVARCSPPIKHNLSSSKNIYSWYVYAPFGKAFADLKQLIRCESNPNERIWILRIMLKCAGDDLNNIRILLKYYREHHMNEAYKFKIHFINHLLTKTDAHKYDKETWGYLNEMFNSMEVYTKSDRKVPLCVNSIILYNLVHGENIPEIIEKKFVFENLDNQKKFTKDEREKIFNYLYKHLISKIKEDFTTERDFDATVDVIEKVLQLLKDWNKELQDYPVVVEFIKKLVTLKKENAWDRDLSEMYDIKKSWRKLLFAESVILSPKEDTYFNFLKHDLELFEKHRAEINSLCLNKKKVFDKLLKKIRIYWYQSLADSFKTAYIENLEQEGNQQFSIRGLCILLSQKELLHLIEKYVPTGAKIDWSQSDNLDLNVRKYIATCMHLARPQPTLSVALFYAKGDYMQYVLPSLNAILYNLSSSNLTAKYTTDLLNSPASLQKHGIRVAFSKLKYNELKSIFAEIWKSSKNKSIRADIFNQTYARLCRERDESIILEIWELLSLFVNSLTSEENRKIYVTLSKVYKVPLSVRAAFWMKSYEFLKSLPVKANCSGLIDDLNNQMNDIMEFLDNDFMAKIFLENIDKKISTQKYDYAHQIALFLLSTKSEIIQKERYEKIFVPIIDSAFTTWDKEYENIYYSRFNLNVIFEILSDEFQDVVLNNKMVFPIAMYTTVLNKIQSSLSIKENYILLTYVKLSLGYINIIHDLKVNKNLLMTTDLDENLIVDEISKWRELHAAAAPIFGALCLEHLKQDVAVHFSSIYIIFANVLNDIFNHHVRYYQLIQMRILKVFLDCKDFIQGTLLVIKAIPVYLYEDDEKALKVELLHEISTHPSDEVIMHYNLLQIKST